MIVRLSLAAPGLAMIAAACSSGVPAGPSPLVSSVSTVWLARHLDDANVVLLDARPDRRIFDAGHLPGAVHLSLPGLGLGAGGGAAPPPLVLREVLRKQGIGEHVHVVVYAGGTGEARGVARLLLEAGQRRVSVLEGGVERWSLEGRPLARGQDAVSLA